MRVKSQRSKLKPCLPAGRLGLKYAKRGFTIVELLVVAAITMILVVVVAVNTDKAKSKSRDAQRRTDLATIASAIETYKADNKHYPILNKTGSVCYVSGGGYTVTADKISTTPNIVQACVDQYTALLVGYLPVMPVDPGPSYYNNASGYLRQYLYISTTNTGIDYKIIARFPESCNSADSNLIDPDRSCSTTNNYAWAIYSPGGAGY